MTIRTEIDALLDQYPDVDVVRVNCTARGGKRIFGGDVYRGHHLKFCGASRAGKKKALSEREAKFRAAQIDAFPERQL